MCSAPGRSSVSKPVTGDGAARAVLMVRPAHFGWNPETQASNAYQRNDPSVASTAAARAREEFDALAAALSDAGVAVHALDDRPEPVCPDAVFPNNWVSFHCDGTVVLYPMLAPSRRRERRLDLLLQLEQGGGYEVRRLVDLTYFETRAEFLEGTGSLVLDHDLKLAYACLSPRTHEAPLREFCDELGYEPVVFGANDPAGRPVYHTNVVLSVGPSLAVVAAADLLASDRGRIVDRLARPGRVVVAIDRDRAAAFAANVLELGSESGSTVLALSASAAQAVSDADWRRIRAVIDRVVSVPIPTIEALGGGSVRCMLAEVFLPRRPTR